MSDLDDTIAKLRALPEAERDAVAAQIELLLEGANEDLLTPQQWAEVESIPGNAAADEDRSNAIQVKTAA